MDLGPSLDSISHLLKVSHLRFLLWLYLAETPIVDHTSHRCDSQGLSSFCFSSANAPMALAHENDRPKSSLEALAGCASEESPSQVLSAPELEPPPVPLNQQNDDVNKFHAPVAQRGEAKSLKFQKEVDQPVGFHPYKPRSSAFSKVRNAFRKTASAQELIDMQMYGGRIESAEKESAQISQPGRPPQPQPKPQPQPVQLQQTQLPPLNSPAAGNWLTAGVKTPQVGLHQPGAYGGLPGMTVSPSTLASMCGMSAQMNSQVGLQMVAQQMAQQMAAQINAKVAEMAIQQIAQHTNTAMLQHMNPLVAPQQVAAPQQQPMVWIPADKYNALLQCATTNSVLQQINQPPISNAAPQIQLSQLQPQVAAQLRAAGTQSRPINWPISSFRTFEETEKFLNDSVTEFPEPSNVYTPYECGYCGEVKMTTASRSGELPCVTLPKCNL